MTEQTCEHEAAEENSRSLWHYEVAQAHPRPVESCGKCEQIYETETGITITVIVAEPDDIDEVWFHGVRNRGMPVIDQDEDDPGYILMTALQEDQDEAEVDRPLIKVISETCDQCGKTGYIILVISLNDPMETFVTETDDGQIRTGPDAGEDLAIPVHAHRMDLNPGVHRGEDPQCFLRSDPVGLGQLWGVDAPEPDPHLDAVDHHLEGIPVNDSGYGPHEGGVGEIAEFLGSAVFQP